jgi:iron complex transport system ATP-binding protein
MSAALKNDLRAEGLVVDLGGAHILEAASLDVKAGEVVGLIGPNGAGKSTLLRALLGLVPLVAGQITLEGESLGDRTPRERARLLAYAPQGAPVHWPLTVQRLVELGRMPHLGPWQSLGARDEARVAAALEATETAHLKDRIVTSLSGGERAGVMLARAIAVDAPWLLADEPVASLDPYHQIEVMEILQGLARAGAGVIVVLHDLALAMRFCHRVFLLDHGKVVASGPPRDVLGPENLEKVYRVTAYEGSHENVPFLIPWRRLKP